MEEDFLTGNKVLLSKKYSFGNIYMIEMPNNMIVVVAFKKDKIPLHSRTFLFTDKLKKDVLKDSKQYFKQLKEVLCQNKTEEDLDY